MRAIAVLRRGEAMAALKERAACLLLATSLGMAPSEFDHILPFSFFSIFFSILLFSISLLYQIDILLNCSARPQCSPF